MTNILTPEDIQKLTDKLILNAPWQPFMVIEGIDTDYMFARVTKHFDTIEEVKEFIDSSEYLVVVDPQVDEEIRKSYTSKYVFFMMEKICEGDSRHDKNESVIV